MHTETGIKINGNDIVLPDGYTISTKTLMSAVNTWRATKRKVKANGSKPTCVCGECRICKNREYTRKSRERQRTQAA